jgi:hypothetical protein
MNVPIKPEALPELREVKTKDLTGRVISTFEGSPSAWLRQFADPPRRVVSMKTR